MEVDKSKFTEDDWRLDILFCPLFDVYTFILRIINKNVDKLGPLYQKLQNFLSTTCQRPQKRIRVKHEF